MQCSQSFPILCGQGLAGELVLVPAEVVCNSSVLKVTAVRDSPAEMKVFPSSFLLPAGSW